ncbi:MAG: sigma-54 dependent transcriptional regulator [Candidatus Poribacteria bacterium]|nr:sigma-54 dependent transcriptional regulator [Candidatus Poribacteria bacterium]
MNKQPAFIELPSAQMQAIYNTVKQVVKSNIPFLITGETGVGKEGIAKYIHENSPRRDNPFIAINCGRFSTELLQSELFGHEAGAFTSAIRQRQGAFEQANGGILFLDEVPEMSLDAQKMLLRVLDTTTFTRLGGNQPLAVDVHILTATNRNIEKIVEKDKFREDLYYRLKGMTLHLPPLRYRTEDIPPLVETFIREFSSEYGKEITGITPEALTRLQEAAWPGNIRQLRSTIQTAIALATTDILEPKDFPNIYPEFLQRLISIWGTLPQETQHAIWKALHPETQHIIMHELSAQTPQPWYSARNSIDAETVEDTELLNIENMNQNQILRAVAQMRIEKFASLREAAESLGIDIRTLQRHAQWSETDNNKEPDVSA